ncbi:5290_t:CDS:2 [Diversispora eburnea]|uniref:5290_t:CDS:1 n=1 Tax=Diversispora eburnea TaxID=1213867 RepID=A0A9N8V118_9GLOM|nr:5290_t:CDS:2 [Diversispora eburnea]
MSIISNLFHQMDYNYLLRGLLKLISSLNFISILFIVLGYLFIRPYISYFKSLRDPQYTRAPGPLPLPFIGYLSILFGDIAENNFKLSAKYGDICEIEMFGYRYVLISNPKLLGDLFSPSVNSPFLRRMPLMPGFKELGMDKEGLLLNLDIPKWRHNRKFFQQSLSPPSFLELSTKYTRETCEELIEHWNKIIDNKQANKNDNKIYIRMDKWYRAFTSDMMGLVAAGREIYRRLREDYINALNFFVFIPKFLWNLPFIQGQCKFYRGILDSLTEFEIKFIKDLRPDFLTMLLTMNQDSDPTPDDIKQNLREMFSAGTGTTTTTLCSIAYLLAKHPEIEKRMVDEILSVIGQNNPIDSSNLSKLTYTEAVLNESMRLYPVVPVTYRFSPEISTQIDKYRFPPDTLFAINLGHIHRDARYFKDPEKFNPDRFLGNWRENIPNYAFSPFGHGMRSCPGKNFSMTEIKVILATIYRKFTFKLVNPNEPLHLQFAAVNDITKMEVYIEKRELPQN